MDSFLQDLRYALRQIARTPSFGALAVACLAAGIGVNAAAFSMLDALMIRSLPGVERQGELRTVLLGYRYEQGGTANPAQLSVLDWQAFKGALPAFSHSGVFGPSSVALDVAGQPRAVRADFVSGGFFATLGTRPAAGRLLDDADDGPGAPAVAVLGHSLWQREYGADPAVVGRPVRVSGVTFTIVGVAPDGFTGLYPGELVADPEMGAPYLYIPLAAAPLVRAASRATLPQAVLDDNWLLLAGRLAPGAGTAQLEAQLAAAAAGLAGQYPEWRLDANASVRLPSTASAAETLAIVGFVMAVPLLIMLVVCANLANQMLARGIQRSGEIAVRLSLGASRGRVVRQLMAEAALLALVAGALGFVAARAITTIVATQVVVMPFRIPVDGRVFLFSAALALGTALVFALVPALRATRVDLARAVNEGGRAGGYRRSRLRSGLVVVQVAASVSLLAVAGVFVRAITHARVNDVLGNADRVLTVAPNLEILGYDSIAGRDFQRRAIERLAALPGVAAVGLATFGPMAEPPWQRVLVAGSGGQRGQWVGVAEVAGDWAGAVNMAPVHGRAFTAAELRGGAGVALIDDVAATDLVPGIEPLGQTLRIGEGDAAYAVTVIGVIPTLQDPRGHADNGVVVVPRPELYAARARLYVRTTGDAAALRGAVAGTVQSIDPRLPAPAVVTVGESLDENAAGVKQIALGASAMGAIALLLAALGLYAVLSFIVEQRRYEIGVRMALGARTGSVTALVLRQSLVLGAIGTVVGALVAAGTSVGLRGMMFGLPPVDPLAFAGSALLMLAVVVLASVVPALRAARVDPMVSLRSN